MKPLSPAVRAEKRNRKGSSPAPVAPCGAARPGELDEMKGLSHSDERGGLPSASSFHMDRACEGRQNLLRELGEKVATDTLSDDDQVLANRGQRIHEARRTGKTLNLDESELDAYQKACAIERRVVEEWMRDRNLDVLSDPIVEQRLWFNGPDSQPLLSGQLDVLYLAGSDALLCDWKTSAAYYAGDVGKSWQIRVYALLVWKEWPHVKRVRAAFIKPEAFGPKLDTADYSEKDLIQVETAVVHTCWLSRQANAPRRAGNHCRFCQARAACDEAARYSMLPILATGATAGITPKQRVEELVALMPIESAASVWRKSKIIKAILEAIDDRLKALPDGELDALGLSKKEGRRNDKITAKVDAFMAMREAGFSSNQILGALEFGKGHLVELYQKAKECSKKAAEEWYESTFGDFITRDRAKPSLVEKKP